MVTLLGTSSMTTLTTIRGSESLTLKISGNK